LENLLIEANLCEHHYAFAIPCYDGKIFTETTVSLLESSSQLAMNQVSHQFIMLRGGALIDAVRNELIHRFLTMTKADTLICIDADITFSFDMMKRLLVYSHHYPIVCGAYTSKTEDPRFIITTADNKLDENGLLPIKSMGFGFVAIQRQVLEDMKPFLDTYHMKEYGTDVHAYFRLLIENNKYTGEDIYFFNKAREAGFQPMLDPQIELGHLGTKHYTTPFKAVLNQIITE
jgi:hypothetical protein